MPPLQKKIFYYIRNKPIILLKVCIVLYFFLMHDSNIFQTQIGLSPHKTIFNPRNYQLELGFLNRTKKKIFYNISTNSAELSALQ